MGMAGVILTDLLAFGRHKHRTSASGSEHRGIGPVYAKKLVRAFGEKVFDTIEADTRLSPEGKAEERKKASREGARGLCGIAVPAVNSAGMAAGGSIDVGPVAAVPISIAVAVGP